MRIFGNTLSYVQLYYRDTELDRRLDKTKTIACGSKKILVKVLKYKFCTTFRKTKKIFCYDLSGKKYR